MKESRGRARWVMCVAMIAAGCGARQTGASRPAPVAVCTPHLVGAVGSTLLIHTVCEADAAAVTTFARATARRRRGLLGSRDGGARLGRGGDPGMLAYPLRAGPDGEPMPEADDHAGLARQAPGAVAGMLARGELAGAWTALGALPAPALLEALDLLDAGGLIPALSGVPVWVAAGAPRVAAVLAVRQVADVDAALLVGDVPALHALSVAGRALDSLGTAGIVPAPGGWFVFWSPEPGVIVYQYRTTRVTLEPDHQRDAARPGDWGGDRAPHREPPSDREGDSDGDGLALELEPRPAPSPSTITAIGAGLLILLAIVTIPVSG